MRLVGMSFTGQAEADQPRDFDGIVMEAVTLLKGDGLSKVEAEALREALIQGYRWILVDEYQDIGAEEYALIAAVAGRSLEDPDQRMGLFAVGDDDQNIYAFAGASIEFIRRFEEDYTAKPSYLVENYRSTAAIIAAANRVIAPAANRMKADRDIIVNHARRRAPESGMLARLDPVAQGRVQFLRTGPSLEAQASAAVDELIRLSRLVPDWSWSGAAIIAREWRFLEPVRSYCEAQGIPVQLASETMPPLWRLREVQAFLAFLRIAPGKMLTVNAMQTFIASQPVNRWWILILDAIAALETDWGDKAIPVGEIIELLAEWTRDARQKQRGLLLLTAHRAKGLEFDDVIILDGGWDRTSKGEDRDAPRRLFYVAMTRAKRSLAIVSMQDRHPILLDTAATLLQRSVFADEAAQADCGLRYQVAEPHIVDLSWAGRQTASNPAHQALARIQTGDPINLMEIGGRWLIRNGEGVVIGRMAQSYRPPAGLRFIRGEAAAIIHWRKLDNAEEFHSRLRREAWEVVLPELVFGP